MQENSLTIFERGNQLLAEANTVQKAKELKDLALTAADWAKHKGLGEEAVKHAMSYALDASRRMGELLQATERADKETRYGSTRQEQPQKTTKTPTLQELGITRKESSRAQKMARLSEEKFQAVKSGTITTRADCTVRRDTAMRAAASVWDFAQFCARSVRAPWCIVAILAAIIARCDRRGRPGATGRPALRREESAGARIVSPPLLGAVLACRAMRGRAWRACMLMTVLSWVIPDRGYSAGGLGGRRRPGGRGVFYPA